MKSSEERIHPALLALDSVGREGTVSTFCRAKRDPDINAHLFPHVIKVRNDGQLAIHDVLHKIDLFIGDQILFLQLMMDLFCLKPEHILFVDQFRRSDSRQDPPFLLDACHLLKDVQVHMGNGGFELSESLLLRVIR